jgi:polyisoprenoid-binding protein YceI
MTSVSELSPGTWTVDPAHSEVGFVARHLMVSKVRGSFAQFEATVLVGDSSDTYSVEATVQLASIDTGSTDRDAHLRGADFFDTDNHPVMTFTSASVSSDKLVGDLTIKGVTRQVAFDLDFAGVSADPWGGTRAGFEATTEINRKDFGLTWNAALETGGFLVGDEVKISLSIQAVAA